MATIKHLITTLSLISRDSLTKILNIPKEVEREANYLSHQRALIRATLMKEVNMKEVRMRKKIMKEVSTKKKIMRKIAMRVEKINKKRRTTLTIVTAAISTANPLNSTVSPAVVSIVLATIPLPLTLPMTVPNLVVHQDINIHLDTLVFNLATLQI